MAQLQEWFGDLGVPVLALGGYSSQTYEDDVIADAAADERPAVLLYAGDHDPSGEDIDRDFIAQTDCWDEVRRVALTARQVEQYALPPQPGKGPTAARGASSTAMADSCRSNSMPFRRTSCASLFTRRSRSSGTPPYQQAARAVKPPSGADSWFDVRSAFGERKG